MSVSSGTLTVNLDAIRKNYQKLCHIVGLDCVVKAVVKANAYGLGATKVCNALIEEGCKQFYVATPEEGEILRSFFKTEGYEHLSIFILNGFYKSAADLYDTKQLIPVLGSLTEIKNYAGQAYNLNKRLPAVLHFNTGMNRLGLDEKETQYLLEKKDILDALHVETIISHFACADDPKHPMTQEQYDNFLKISALFPRTPRSIANSAGILASSDHHLESVRPGMALYGLNPIPTQQNIMIPAVSLSAPVLKIANAKKGETTGYSASYTFTQNTPIATLSIGYADGLLWSLKNKGYFYWNGIPCPIRGRVSMDLTVIDLSDVPESQHPKPGDILEFIGPHQSVDDIAKKAGTISYEIITSLGNRFKRIYK